MITKIPYYSNESFLEKIRKHNYDVAKTGDGKFRYNAVFIDLNAVEEAPDGTRSGISCNFRCPDCFKAGERNAHPTDRLNFDEIKQVIVFAKQRGASAVVYAGLGEPMIDQDFWNVLDYAYKNKMWTVLFTNGTFLTEKNTKILLKKKAIVIIKVNTLDKEKQEAMVGNIKGASEKISGGLRHLINAGFKAPRLAVDSLISKDNANDLKDVLRFCRKNEIVPYFESFIIKTLRKRDYESKILCQKELDQLFLELQKIDREEFGVNTKLIKGMRVYGQSPCIKYWTMFSVRNNGDVALCVSDTESIGNIRKHPLEKVLTPKNKKILQRYKSGCNCSLATSEKVETESIKLLFAKFALAKESYEKHMKETGHVEAQKRILVNFYDLISGTVLDIATGTGTIARLIMKNTNAKVYGIDFSGSMIKKANEYSKKENLKINFCVANVEDIPCKRNFFNCITCSYGFYWFCNLKRVIKEIKRVLKPTGIVILLEEEFKKGQLPQPIFGKKSRYLKELALLERYMPISEIKKLMIKNNFVLIKEVRKKVDDKHDTLGLLFKIKK